MLTLLSRTRTRFSVHPKTPDATLALSGWKLVSSHKLRLLINRVNIPLKNPRAIFAWLWIDIISYRRVTKMEYFSYKYRILS